MQAASLAQEAAITAGGAALHAIPSANHVRIDRTRHSPLPSEAVTRSPTTTAPRLRRMIAVFFALLSVA